MARLTHDYQQEFLAGTGTPLACRIRVYDAGDATVIVATEPAAEAGASGALALLASALERKHCPDPARPLVWVEEREAGTDPRRPFEATYDRVIFSRDDQGRLTAPRRQPLDRAQLEALLGGPLAG